MRRQLGCQAAHFAPPMAFGCPVSENGRSPDGQIYRWPDAHS
jgi:hypothetical protein